MVSCCTVGLAAERVASVVSFALPIMLFDHAMNSRPNGSPSELHISKKPMLVPEEPASTNVLVVEVTSIDSRALASLPAATQIVAPCSAREVRYCEKASVPS